jgi:hypothetical protein
MSGGPRSSLCRLHPCSVVVGRRDRLPAAVHLFRVAGRRGGDAAVAHLRRAEAAADLPAEASEDGEERTEGEDEEREADCESHGEGESANGARIAAVKVFAAVVLIVLIALAAVWALARMLYGVSFRGPLPPLTLPQTVLISELRRDVAALAALGPRSTVLPEALHGGATRVARELGAAGYAVTRQTFETEGVVCENVEAELRGGSKPDEIVVIGAHYDSVDESPGADDNASGVAAMLALARRFAREHPARTIRFVAFVNEEPPNFQTNAMGSWQYARRSRQRGEKIVAMLSLEAVGYYSDERGSQQYPPPLNLLYPNRGDFLGFVSNVGSRGLLRRALRTFRRNARFPSQGAVLPPVIPQAGWSDQWSFWQFGYPALMVTDTAVFRNPHYHVATDRPETLDYDRFARAVDGLLGVARELAR